MISIRKMQCRIERHTNRKPATPGKARNHYLVQLLNRYQDSRNVILEHQYTHIVYDEACLLIIQRKYDCKSK